MERYEIIRRLERIADHAVHTPGEKPFILGLDDGIALKEAAEILREPESIISCAECKYYGYKNMTNVDGFCYCFKRKEYPYPDWYCADGVKKMEAEDDDRYKGT